MMINLKQQTVKTKFIFLSAFFASWLLVQAQQSIPYWRFSTAMNTANPALGLVTPINVATGDWKVSFNGSPFVPALHVSDVIPNPLYWWTWNPEVNNAGQNSYGWVSYPFQTPPNDPRDHSSQGAGDMLYRIKFFLPANPVLTVDLDIYGDDFVIDVSVNGNVTTYPTPPTGQTGQNGNLNVPVKFISSTNWITNDTNTIQVHCSSQGVHAGLMVRSNSKTTGISDLNSEAEGFALDQNIPNPFSNETVIKYTLPPQIKTASLIVYDLSGKQLTSFPLELSAKSITITSEKLPAGIYICSVTADGKIMGSKRIVVANKQ